MERDYGAEIDKIKVELQELLQIIGQSAVDRISQVMPAESKEAGQTVVSNDHMEKEGAVYYSGRIRYGGKLYRAEPQARELQSILSLNNDKAAKILAALGHKQRLDILSAVLKEPLTGTELVERLQMGTTGQLYHHLKALLGADLLRQEERGGQYIMPPDRTLPFALLLAAVSDLMETSDYLEMTEARNQAGRYLGAGSAGGYDVHLLLWAVVENCILEHQAGYCSEVRIYVHDDGSLTVSDNGRGIPVKAIPQTEKTVVQAVLTDLHRLDAPYTAPGAEKGINIAVANALSRKLTVEIRKNGTTYRQDYKYGIPQTGLNAVGATGETGTSVTFLPEPDLFGSTVDRAVLDQKADELSSAYPGLTIHIE